MTEKSRFDPLFAVLEASYGGEKPQEVELLTLMAVLSDAGMSNRSVADAMAAFAGLKYSYLLYNVSTHEADSRVTAESKNSLLKKLRPHGFDEWARSLY